MKKIHLLLLFGLFILGGASRTIAQQDSTLMERFLLDFSVPDMPAFKALGTDPSSILRPSDVKKFAAMLSPFHSNGKGVIPKNFALESAPWKAASKGWSLHDYNTDPWKRFLYRSSFSLGAVEDATVAPMKVGVGYRVSFLSKKADIYRAAEVRNKIFGRDGTQAFIDIYTQLTNHWVNHVVTPTPSPASAPTYYQDHRDEFAGFLSNIEDYLASHPDPVLQQTFDQLIAQFAAENPDIDLSAEVLKDIVQEYGKNIDTFIEEYKARNWNATRFDVALAWVGQSTDSLIKHAEFSSLSLWLTAALRMHQGGQLLIGINPVLPRSQNDSSKFTFAGNLRYYLGTQDFRGFLETQYKYRKNEVLDKALLINLGAEFRIGSNFWLVASTGLENYLAEDNPLSKLVSGIDIRYGFNKSK
jgi:hypothetical protein